MRGPGRSFARALSSGFEHEVVTDGRTTLLCSVELGIHIIANFLRTPRIRLYICTLLVRYAAGTLLQVTRTWEGVGVLGVRPVVAFSVNGTKWNLAQLASAGFVGSLEVGNAARARVAEFGMQPLTWTGLAERPPLYSVSSKRVLNQIFAPKWTYPRRALSEGERATRSRPRARQPAHECNQRLANARSPHPQPPPSRRTSPSPACGLAARTNGTSKSDSPLRLRTTRNGTRRCAPR